MSAFDPRDLRHAFGRYMTGVTVVTTCAADGTPCVFTANSFTSVSLDPPLLLVCPSKHVSSLPVFAECSRFGVSVLAEGQEAVSNTFASYSGDRFSVVSHTHDVHGVPLIDGAIARFSCSTWQSLPAGDHMILIGEVTDFTQTDAPGLGYSGGQYFSLGLERAALEHAAGSTICGAIIAHGDTVCLEQTPQGYRPPQTRLADRGQLRKSLEDALAVQGLPVELGPAYSVYDDAGSRIQYAYFLASSPNPPSNALCTVPISDLPGLTYTTPAIADMMTRYALEARRRSFGLYLGDTTRGELHILPERT